MQEAFYALLADVKRRGTTVFMLLAIMAGTWTGLALSAPPGNSGPSL